MGKKVKIDRLFSGTVMELIFEIDRMIWKFNSIKSERIFHNINSFKVSEYVGFHIRCGDKVNEAVLIDLNQYITKVESISSLRTAFVASDDYSTISRFNSEHTDWSVYSFEYQ